MTTFTGKFTNVGLEIQDTHIVPLIAQAVRNQVTATGLIIPVGTIFPFAKPVYTGAEAKLVPAGWFLCDGRSISTTMEGTQPTGNLFTEIGYSHAPRFNVVGTGSNKRVQLPNHRFANGDSISLYKITPEGRCMAVPQASQDISYTVMALSSADATHHFELSSANISDLETRKNAATTNQLLLVKLDKFRLPDLRGRTLLGAGSGYHTVVGADGASTVNALSQRKFGDAGGDETHTLTIGEMPSHHHILGQSGTHRGTAANVYGTENTTLTRYWGFYESAFTNTRGNKTSSVGGNLPHNNMQPWAAINYIIKA